MIKQYHGKRKENIVKITHVSINSLEIIMVIVHETASDSNSPNNITEKTVAIAKCDACRKPLDTKACPPSHPHASHTISWISCSLGILCPCSFALKRGQEVFVRLLGLDRPRATLFYSLQPLPSPSVSNRKF